MFMVLKRMASGPELRRRGLRLLKKGSVCSPRGMALFGDLISETRPRQTERRLMESEFEAKLNSRLKQELRADRVLLRLDQMAREALSIPLVVVVVGPERLTEIPVTEGDLARCDFCSLAESMPAFRRPCAACRTSTLLEALAMRMSKITCFAGVTVLFALASTLTSGAHVLVAASSRHFRAAGKGADDGWRRVARQLRGSRLDLGRLRKAYLALPKVNPRDLVVLKGIVESASAEVRRIIAHLERSLAPDSPRARQGETRLDELLQSSLLLSTGRTPAARTDRAAGRALVGIVKSMVEHWPHLPYSVKEIARVSRLSPNYFSSLFRRYTGQAFAAFLSENRILMAKRYLADKKTSIKEIGLTVGFSDPNYFSRWFRHLSSLTPEAWRARALSTPYGRKRARASKSRTAP